MVVNCRGPGWSGLQGRVLDADLLKNTAGSTPRDGIGTNFMKTLVVDQVIKKVCRYSHCFTGGRVGWKAGEGEGFGVGATLVPLDPDCALPGTNGRVVDILPVGESPVESCQKGQDLAGLHSPGGSDELNVSGKAILDLGQVVATKPIHVESEGSGDFCGWDHFSGVPFGLNSGTVQGEVRCTMEDRMAATLSLEISLALFPHTVRV